MKAISISCFCDVNLYSCTGYGYVKFEPFRSTGCGLLSMNAVPCATVVQYAAVNRHRHTERMSHPILRHSSSSGMRAAENVGRGEGRTGKI